MFGRGAWLVSLALIVATAFIYAPVGHFHFTNYDDTDYITENAQVLAGLTRQGIVWAFTTGHAETGIR